MEFFHAFIVAQALNGNIISSKTRTERIKTEESTIGYVSLNRANKKHLMSESNKCLLKINLLNTRNANVFLNVKY